MAAVAALVVGLTTGGDDPVRERGLRTAVVDDARFGVRLRHPRSWRRDRDPRAIRLVSPDRRLGLSVTTVASRPAAARVRAGVERAVLRTFRDPQVVGRSRGSVGGRPARLTAARARNGRGEQLDVLLAVASSRWRTYAVMTFGSPRASQQVLREAESILASLRFTRPAG